MYLHWKKMFQEKQPCKGCWGMQSIFTTKASHWARERCDLGAVSLPGECALSEVAVCYICVHQWTCVGESRATEDTGDRSPSSSPYSYRSTAFAFGAVWPLDTYMWAPGLQCHLWFQHGSICQCYVYSSFCVYQERVFACNYILYVIYFCHIPGWHSCVWGCIHKFIIFCSIDLSKSIQSLVWP